MLCRRCTGLVRLPIADVQPRPPAGSRGRGAPLRCESCDSPLEPESMGGLLLDKLAQLSRFGLAGPGALLRAASPEPS